MSTPIPIWEWPGQRLPNAISPTGKGPVATRGGQVIVMRPGDTVYTPPGEWHWHGAAPDHFTTHLAMWEAPDPADGTAETEWGEHVGDNELPPRRRAGVTLAISDTARRHHDALFPGHVSTMAVTSPPRRCASSWAPKP